MKRNGQLVRKLVFIALGAVILTAVILTAIGVRRVISAYVTTIEEELSASAHLLADLVSNQYDGDWSLNEEGVLCKGEDVVGPVYTEQMDDLHTRTGIDFTVFYGKTRNITTLTKKGTNDRIVGTDASDAVIAEVLNGGNEYLAENIKIEGDTYYGYYIPLKNSDGSIVGMVFTGRPSDDITSVKVNTILIMGGIALAVVIIICVAGLILSAKISKSMKNITGSIESVAQGELNTAIDNSSLTRKDEIGVIADNTSNLILKLKEVIGNAKMLTGVVASSSDQLSDSAYQASEASAQVSEAVEEVSKGAISQASSVQTAADNTKDIDKDINDINENVDELKSRADEMQAACNNAMKALEQLIRQSSSVTDSVTIIDKQIRNTNDAVANIAEASNIISSISAQTNLLSLNASIEAARAGEAGKGFAVVATEIGTLADQSGEAAVKISAIVDELVSQSKQTVDTLGILNESFEAQTKQLDSTRSDMADMQIGVNSVTESTNRIAGSISRVNTSKNNLNDVITDLSAISEENAASTEETNASMEELRATFDVINQSAAELKDLAFKLNEDLSYFNINI
jgi:methyl-accepting chemotaxis protein